MQTQSSPSRASQPPETLTERAQAKGERRKKLLSCAAVLFAKNGYNGVSIEELGAAAGVSGPALYRHFSGKQEILGALLLQVSQELLDGARTVIEEHGSAQSALEALVAFHVDFALHNADVIRVQDRDLASLGEQERRRVRRLQRSYINQWVEVLQTRHAHTDPPALLPQRAQAVFGLINSTAHTLRGEEASPDSSRQLGTLLRSMALAALDAPGH